MDEWKTLGAIERLTHASQRPCIAASVGPVGLTFDDNGGGITLNITLKNSDAFPQPMS